MISYQKDGNCYGEKERNEKKSDQWAVPQTQWHSEQRWVRLDKCGAASWP